MSSSIFSNYTIKTDDIRANIVPTDGEHIHFDANQHSGMGKDFPTARWMTIRGIDYGVSAHFHKWADGSWNLGPESDATNALNSRMYRHLYMTRTGSNSPNEASDAAKRKALEIITPLIAQWVKDHEAELIKAECSEIDRQCIALTQEIIDLEAKIEKAKRERSALRRKRSTLASQ